MYTNELMNHINIAKKIADNKWLTESEMIYLAIYYDINFDKIKYMLNQLFPRIVEDIKTISENESRYIQSLKLYL